MIKSYKNAKAQKVHETAEPRGCKGLDGEVAARRMDELEAASALSDFPALRSINLHKLTGNRKGPWAINSNGPWRIVFTSTKDGWADVEIVDYH